MIIVGLSKTAAIAKPWTDIVGKDENSEIEKATIAATPHYGSKLPPFEASIAYVTSPGISTI
jgi:hypothetical protein